MHRISAASHGLVTEGSALRDPIAYRVRGVAVGPHQARGWLRAILCLCALAVWPSIQGEALAQTVRDDFFIANGTVNAELLSGSTLYVGGRFTHVGAVTGAGVPLDGGSGLAVSGFPRVVGEVDAVVSDGAGGWYIGGLFTTVGGIARSNLAHVLADNSVSSWDPNANGAVRALAVDGSVVYAGGDFTNVGGQTRNRIAALDAGTGLATAWDPNANLPVRVIKVSGSTVYAGGSFTGIGGQARARIAALDATTGSATAWSPNANSMVLAIAVDGTTIYVAGQFTSVGGQARNRIAALDAGTGLATPWNPSSNTLVQSLAVDVGTVYAGGQFLTIGGQSRNRIAALDATTGLATAWNPNANGQVTALAFSGGALYAGGDFLNIGGQARSRLAALDTGSGLATSWDPTAYGSVLALAESGGTVYAGGSFNGMGGPLRNNIAAIDVTSGAATAWDPNVNNEVLALALSGGTVYAGGTFSDVGGQPRNSIAAIDPSTGGVTAWNPDANGQVSALAVSGATVYAGGTFSTIGGLPRNNIAALDIATGLATAWDPNANGQVFVFEPHDGIVFVGGAFTSVGGQPRNSIAALDVTSGLATAWNANANGTVRALDVSCGTLYVGGFFNNIGGQARSGIAALDVTTGLASGWDPNANGPVFAVSLNAGRVYASGVLNNIGGQARNRIAALDAVSGFASAWDPNANGTVRALAVGGGAVYAGGSYTTMGGLGQANLSSIQSDGSFTCPTITLAPTGLATGVISFGYAQTISASGGVGPYCFAITAGSLPAGLSLDAGSGQISGTPTAAGTSVFTIGATDVNGCTGTGSNTITIFATPPASAVAANTTGLCISPAHPCVSVPVMFTRAEATPARAVSVTLQLDVTKLGLCTPGSPAASFHMGPWLSGFASTNFAVVNNGGGSYTVDQTILGTPCGVTVGGELFTIDLASVGGDGSGAITVTSVKVRDCDSAPIPALAGPAAALSILNTPITLLPATLPNGSTGIGYGQALTTNSGAAPFVFLVTSGSLAPGLSLSSGGVISGTPTTTGTFAFSVGVTDVNDCVGSRAYNLTIDCGPMTVRPVGIVDGSLGDAYSQTLSIIGGVAPLDWSITGGSLPAGLALGAASGEISGTPTEAGTSVFTVGVTDANGCTGSGSYTVTIFATAPTAGVAANTSGLCISPAHPCASVPVVYTRTDATPARAMSVTLQLDVTKLALCTPGPPAPNFHLGTWLTGFTNTNFVVVDNGGGSYTVDQAILGTPCGVTVGGELFTIDLTSVDGDGSGAITVTSVKVRDCDSAPIPALPGPLASILISSAASSPVTDLAAAQVTSGNGPGGTTGITLTWTTGGAGTVSLYRAPFGSYPVYDAAGPVSPPNPASAPGAPWTLASASATSGFVDHPPTRGFWHYVALVTNACGNVSASSNLSAGTLDYHLGDVSDGVAVGEGNNEVGGEDISLLGANYGIGQVEIASRGVEYLDVGPTTDSQPTSRPTPDHQVDFEDLILFATNYHLVSAPQMAARPAGSERTASGPEAFQVSAPSLVEAGTTVTAVLRLKAGGRIQGFSAQLGWDATVVAPEGMTSSQWVEGQGGIVLTPGQGAVDAALLGVRGVGLTGEGEVARVRFRVLRTGDAGIRLAKVEARDAGNHALGEGDLTQRVEAERPTRTVLLAPWPNPFQGSAGLEFSLAEAGGVELAVYGVDGRRVRTLVREQREAGVYREAWDGRDDGRHAVGSGVFYVRLIAGGRRFTTMLVHVK